MQKECILIILFASAVLFYPVDATVWYVHPDSALNSIEAALCSCAVHDTVLVGPGTYYENITWPNTQGIRLMSEMGADTTIIDGCNAGRVIAIFEVVDTSTVIEGFTVQNGFSSVSGGGIQCDSNACPLITDNVIINNYGASGGGVRCRKSWPTIKYNTINNNTAYYGGAGISCALSAAIIAYNTISDNTTIQGYAGGIHCLFGGPVIEGNTITNNTTGWAGGGIECSNVHATIINNVITGNYAGIRGGGISVYQDIATEIIGNTITQNSAAYQGGGISCEYICSPLIRKNIITHNYAPYYGSGIFCYRNSSPLIDSCIICDNDRDGVCCDVVSSPVLHYNNISNNSGYGLVNMDPDYIINATDNWWGDPSGPSGAGPGSGDSVSLYVDYDPWLTDSVQWFGIQEQPVMPPIVTRGVLNATVISGPLLLPEGKSWRVFDITGRLVKPDMIRTGIYFIEKDGEIRQKVVKIR